MANKLSPIVTLLGNDQNGSPRSGAQLFAYITGTQVKANLWVDEDGNSAHTNPIILNASGEIADLTGTRQVVWQEEGDVLDWVLAPATDTDPPLSPYWTLTAVPGLNDITTEDNAVSQWVTGSAPTLVSSTVFSVVGDQTSIYTTGRRVHTVNSAGDIYSTVVSSSLVAGNTQVTLLHDSGALDSGISSVQYGLLSANNNAVPGGSHYAPRTYQNLVHFTKGIGPEYKQNYSISPSVAANALTIALKGNDGNSLSSTNPLHLTFRDATRTSGKYVPRAATAPLTLTIPAGATLGLGISETNFIDLWAIDNAGSVELAVSVETTFDPGDVVTTTALTTGSDSSGVLYSASARSNVPIVHLGRILITGGATPGFWDGAVSLVTHDTDHDAHGMELFLATGTFTPRRLGQHLIILQGGGGGGGGGATGTSPDAGGLGGYGGAGGAHSNTLAVISVYTGITVTVGAGGAGGAGGASSNSSGSDGSVGGTTSFGSYGTAAGGAGGRGGIPAAVQTDAPGDNGGGEGGGQGGSAGANAGTAASANTGAGGGGGGAALGGATGGTGGAGGSGWAIVLW